MSPDGRRHRALVLAWYGAVAFAVASVAWVFGFGGVWGAASLLCVVCLAEAADLIDKL